MAGSLYSEPRRRALSYAILAPNPHNRQPWLVDLSEDAVVRLFVDRTRLLSATDPLSRQITIGLGRFLELLRMAGAEDGYRVTIDAFPEGSYPNALDARPIAVARFIKDDSNTEFNRRLPDELHVSHFSVINHLYRLGDGRTPLQIAEAFQVTKPTMTNTLGKLTARGLIVIRQNPSDGRSKLVFLTSSGRALREQAITALDPVLDELDRQLDAQDITTILPILKVLREYMDKYRSV